MLKKHAILAALLLATMLAVGCSTTVQMQGTRLSPASVGEVNVETDPNDNSVLNIVVQFMPLPDQLDPELTTYVAWAVPTDSENYSNLGRMKLSEERTAELATTTPYNDFMLVITAESEATVTTPSEFVVFKTPVQTD